MSKKGKKIKKIIWKKEINVLGQQYKIYFENYGKYDELECDGYTIWDLKEIHVCNTNCPLYDKKTMRHEVIHAFLFQSGFFGLQNPKIKGDLHDEMMVDWMSLQFPKLYEIFKELDVLE